MLRERWAQAQSGDGQVILLSGEPGIGKSRLVEELKAQMPHGGARQIEFRCSPYHQNSALHPITEHLQRLLQFAPDDTSQTKLDKLQHMLSHYHFPQADTVPLLAALLSLPHPEGVPPLNVSPQKQKEQTQAVLVAWLMEESEQAPVYNAWEDLHWADPSTLELLDLILSQVPTSPVLVLLTFRPEFTPPWGAHSYLSHLTLSRLGQPLVSAMVERVTGGQLLPDEVLQQIITKTDGVPLFVEELTKMVLESDFVRAVNDQYELTGPLPPLAIPSTLQDSLMARLDRFPTVREVAQLGATIGREFTYKLLAAVSPLAEDSLQQRLKQLVETELVYQRGLPPQARYLFKHALIQDTAYASLLKSRRQQLHQHVAQVLEQQFAATVEIQPEVVAHHYTEAGLSEQAIPYWQKAGLRAFQRSANMEAIQHLSTGLELLQTLPETVQRSEQELLLQHPLGEAYLMGHGYTVPEVGQAFNRAHVLCQQLGDKTQLTSVLLGLWRFYFGQPDHHAARQVGEQLLRVAEQTQDWVTLVMAHYMLASCLVTQGELVAARTHAEHGIRQYAHHQNDALAHHFGENPGVGCYWVDALLLWQVGYPDQAVKRCREALVRAEQEVHPVTEVVAVMLQAWIAVLRREARAA